ncbi:MAG: hypothetical protein H0X30_09210 [Anaerolineae bacterium]|nr:hypothetical protein [Anaerolineae bacterium]
MPRMTYTVDQRTAALVELERCRGDILRASLNTGIPERTLYTWRRRFYAENKRQQPPTLPPPKAIPAFNDDFESLSYIRKQMMSELVRLASTFQEDTAFATPQQRALILTQLIDRLIKLDAHLDPYTPTPMYQSPDEKFVPFFMRHNVEVIDDEENDQREEEEANDIDYNHRESKTEASLPPSDL